MTRRMLWALISTYQKGYMVLPRVTQQRVEEQDVPEVSLSEEGRVGLESKVYAYNLSPKSKESHLCSKLSRPHAAAVAFRKFGRFHICLCLG